MPDRQAALAALQQRLDRSVTDPARVLSQEAEGAAAGLAAVVEPETDLVAARTLGRYHWLRSHVLAQRGHMGDLDAVLRFMLPVYWADPDLVPEPLRTAFRTEPGLAPLVHEGPEALADRATGMVIAFGRSGTLQDLRTAATFFRAAAARTAPDHEDRLVRLNDLGVCLRDLYARTRDQGVLAEAITTERAAVRLARGRPGFAHLGTALQRLFARTAHMGDLEDAVEAGRESVTLADEDDPARPGYLTGLGGAVRSLYLRVNRMELLEEAIRAEREAVALIPPGHPRRAMYLNNLASTLQILWMRTEDPELLDDAVDMQRQAVRTTPGSHPARAGRLIGLVSLLRMQYEGTENMAVLEEAITLAREALRLTPRDHPGTGAQLNSLATVLLIAFKNAGSVSVREAAQFDSPLAGTLSRLFRTMPLLSPEVLEEGVQAARDAVRVTPLDHPDRGEFLINLGHALEVKVERGGPAELLDEALRCYREAGDSQAATTLLRISGYRRYARAAGAAPGHAGAGLRAIEDAIGLVDTFAPRSLVRPDRQHQLSRLNELPGEAAAAALHAGRPVRAVELLEQTRGILAADVLALRSAEQIRLRACAPELAGELDRLRTRLAELDPPDRAAEREPAEGGGAGPGRRSGRRLSAERGEAHEAWQELLGRIRTRPGFEEFMRAPAAARLARQAQDGPIVFVSTSGTRCDALVLTAAAGSPVEAVPLPRLTQADAYDRANRLRRAHVDAADHGIDPQRRITAQREILDVLEWLWDAVAEPVLTRLGHTSRPAAGEPWPRLWWCPVGILAFLPLHAAGYHTENHEAGTGTAAAPRTVLDRVVSSYTTTVGALEHARGATAAPPSTVIVPVPDDPDSPLPGVREETRAISALVPDAHLVADPTRDKVLAALHRHQIVHFACHALADGTDPGRSRLILADHTRAPLTVTDISNLHLNVALAYLSACDTSVTAAHLADEALHITAAFQLAGYRHVVGTLWSVDDRTAIELATDFYGHLTGRGTTPPRAELSAHALHRATRRLRDRYPGTPTLWAAHVHSGP